MKDFTEQRWTDKDLQFLKAHIADMSFEEIAQAINRSAMSVRIKAHRERLLVNINGRSRRPVQNNIVKKMIEDSVSAIENFKPTREFYEQTGLSQKRFWGAARGEYPLQPTELSALANFLHVNLEDFQQSLQMSMEFKDSQDDQQ